MRETQQLTNNTMSTSVNESPIWLRDSNGVMFNEKIIIPVTNEITSYLQKCLHEKRLEYVEQDDIYVERAYMKQCSEILGVTEQMRSQKFRRSVSEYIASHISLQKLGDDTNDKSNDTIIEHMKKLLNNFEDNKKQTKKTINIEKDNTVNKKLQRITKKKQYNNSDADNKPKKVMKKNALKK